MLVTQVRAFFEPFADHERLQPLVNHRQHARPWQFGSERLRLVEYFVLSLNLSQENQTELYHPLHFRELTMPGAPGDDDTSVHLRESFKSPRALRLAVVDDMDRALIDDGCMSCHITEGSSRWRASFATRCTRTHGSCWRPCRSGSGVAIKVSLNPLTGGWGPWTATHFVFARQRLLPVMDGPRLSSLYTSAATEASCRGQVVRSIDASVGCCVVNVCALGREA